MPELFFVELGDEKSKTSEFSCRPKRLYDDACFSWSSCRLLVGSRILQFLWSCGESNPGPEKEPINFLHA